MTSTDFTPWLQTPAINQAMLSWKHQTCFLNLFSFNLIFSLFCCHLCGWDYPLGFWFCAHASARCCGDEREINKREQQKILWKKTRVWSLTELQQQWDLSASVTGDGKGPPWQDKMPLSNALITHYSKLLPACEVQKIQRGRKEIREHFLRQLHCRCSQSGIQKELQEVES